MFSSFKPISALAALCAFWLAAEAEAGVVAHYSFDTDLTTDSGGNNLDLTSVGNASQASGKFGSAAALDGNDYLWNASSLFNISGGDFAISFWYQTDSSGFSPIVSKIATTPNHGYAVNLGGSDISGDLRDTAGGVVTSTRPAGDTSDFQHIVFQRSGGLLELYVNGGAPITSAATSSASTSNAFAIGSRNISSAGGTGSGGGSFFFDGRIDEVWVFDDDLSTTEINNLMESNSITTSIPEPSSLLITLGGLAALGLARRRRRV